MLRIILYTIRLLIKNGIPNYIFYFGDSVGDNFLITVLANNLYKSGLKNIWIKTPYSSLFFNNPTIKLVLPANTLLSSNLLKFLGVKIKQISYTQYIASTDSDIIPDKHIILKFFDDIKFIGEVVAKPMLFLLDSEKKFGQFSKNQIAICTSSATTASAAPMKNKEWYTLRYQQIVDTLNSKYQFIQIGSAADEPLENVIDMRGKTTIRESAAILLNSKLLITHVGFLMHLARAVDCKAVIIYGGREHPSQSGYKCNANIYQPEECSPCWKHNTCDFNKKCMDKITVKMVLKKIEMQLSLGNTTLGVDILIYC